MATDGSTNISDEEKERTRRLPHGAKAPANADTASGGPADEETPDEASVDPASGDAAPDSTDADDKSE